MNDRKREPCPGCGQVHRCHACGALIEHGAECTDAYIGALCEEHLAMFRGGYRFVAELEVLAWEKKPEGAMPGEATFENSRHTGEFLVVPPPCVPFIFPDHPSTLLPALFCEPGGLLHAKLALDSARAQLAAIEDGGFTASTTGDPKTIH